MIRNFVRIISWHTIIVILLSCAATYVCFRYDVVVDLPTSLIGIAIVFPIVFSINAAYKRREEALGNFGSMKAHAVALFFAHRDWTPQGNSQHTVRIKELINRLLNAVHAYLISHSDDHILFEEVYRCFSNISSSIEDLRTDGMSNTEVSRANQYMRVMMIDFERMRNIALYRTPASLRAYSVVFLNLFPVLFAPYFAYLSTEYAYFTGFLIAALYGLILVSLDNIQEDLENPYDQVGVDDLNLNVVEHYNPIFTERL